MEPAYLCPIKSQYMSHLTTFLANMHGNPDHGDYFTQHLDLTLCGFLKHSASHFSGITLYEPTPSDAKWSSFFLVPKNTESKNGRECCLINDLGKHINLEVSVSSYVRIVALKEMPRQDEIKDILNSSEERLVTPVEPL